jgi:t-SNARE complex subunit (syntaxin)
VIDWGQILMTIITALVSGGAVAWYERRERRRNAAAQARKTEAEAEHIEAQADNLHAEAWKKAFDVLESTTKKQVDTLTRQMTNYEVELRRVKADQDTLCGTLERASARIEYLMRGINTLLRQFERLEIAPDWKPDDWKLDG